MDRAFAFGTYRIDLNGQLVKRDSKTKPLLLMLAITVLTLGALLTADALHLSLSAVDEFGTAVLAGTL